LSNYAYILWQKGRTQEAEQQLQTLEFLRDEDYPSEYDDLDYEG
jgi:hypothetical protein